MSFSSPELKNTENEKPDVIKKQEDIAKQYPELDENEKGVLGGLDIKFDKDKKISPEEINKGMDVRFEKEIAKAGTSGKTPEITEGKRQLSEQIAQTTNMKEKIALYQEFLRELNVQVSTQEGAQQRNQTEYQKSLQKDLSKKENLGDLIGKAQNKEREARKGEQASRIAEEKKIQATTDATMRKITSSESLLDWPHGSSGSENPSTYA